MVLAGGVGSFFLFAFLGLGAFVVTGALDRSLGKEKALLLYAALIAVFIFLTRVEAPPAAGVKAGRLSGFESGSLAKADPFQRPAYDHGVERNIFQKYSDTRPLPPISLDSPPWVPLAFPLPPTVPGPAPAYRRVLRGSLPTLTPGDGTAIPEVPSDQFVEYRPAPEDVYDWVLDPAGNRVYIYIRALKRPDTKWIREGDPVFEDLKWTLYRRSEGWDQLMVRFAYVGATKKAAENVEPMQVFERAQQNLSDRPATDSEQAFLRRSVDNLYREALDTYGLRVGLANPTMSALRQAAVKMADVGRTGKEGREGWRRAVLLLERALELAEGATPVTRAEILQELLEAYRALRDESAMLRTLATYARENAGSHLPWTWLGEFMLEIGIPDAALSYQQAAIERSRSDGLSHIGAGDALTPLGEHENALAAYERAGATAGAMLRKAEALLRLARLDEAKRVVDGVLSREPTLARAILLRGAILYAQGDLDTARAAFARVATTTDAQDERARAAYNLGLTCFRLGQHDAALAAFAVCRTALEYGSTPGPFVDERVSPSLGEALVALASGQSGSVLSALERARQEAPGSAYLETLAGVVAERDDNTASASRAFEAAQRLAPEYGELDGWLAITHLRLAEQQVATGADPQSVADAFGRALAFAERAAARERQVDKTAFRMHLRLAYVQLHAQQLPQRDRYQSALETADKVVIEKIDRDQPGAWSIRGYCHYGLGGDENVSQCIRDFQKVLDDIPEDAADHPWSGARAYAATALAQVKHWVSLEEKTVGFPDTSLPRDWVAEQSNGVSVKVDEELGALVISGKTKGADGSMEQPTVTLVNQELFRRETFEEASMLVSIPPKKGGSTANNVTFGLQVVSSGARTQKAKALGVGIYYDKGWVGYRAGGGALKAFEDGVVRREGDGIEKQMWPEDEWIEIRIARLDADKGEMAIYVTTEADGEREVFRDFISGFKSARGKASLEFIGWSNSQEDFDVRIKDVRVVRRNN